MQNTPYGRARAGKCAHAWHSFPAPNSWGSSCPLCGEAMKTATMRLIELAERLTPSGEIGDGMVNQFHEAAALARLEQTPPCEACQGTRRVPDFDCSDQGGHFVPCYECCDTAADVYGEIAHRGL